MGNFGYVVMVIFIIIRIMIAAGLVYLIIVEVRRYRKRGVRRDKETEEGTNGKNTDGSYGSRK